MGRFVVLGLALILLAGLFLWFTRAARPDLGVAAPTVKGAAQASAPLASPSERSSSEVERSAVSEPASASQEAIATQPATVEVRVERGEQGTPVEGAEVVAHGTCGAESIELRGRTDASGSCRLENAQSFVVRFVDVLSTAETTAESRWITNGWVGAGRVLPVTLLVSEGGTLVGRVVDGEAKPVAGARVIAWCGYRFEPETAPHRETRSDELGHFQLEYLGSEFRIVAESPGLACAQGLHGKLLAGVRAEGELEVVLRPVVTLHGRVLGARGEPVAARIKLQEIGYGSSNDRTAVSGIDVFRPVLGEALCGAAGEFELGPIPAGGWRVEAQHPDHHPWQGTTPNDAAREWIIRLESGCGVTGSVVDKAGAVLSGAEVALRASEGLWRKSASAQDGSFAVRGVDCGAGALLMVSAPGHAPWLREGIELVEGVEPRIDVRLEPGLPIAGRVIEADGKPVPGARIALEGERTYERDYVTDEPATLEYLFDRARTFSDEDGRFRLEDLYSGRFEVRAYLPGDERLYQDAVAFAGDEALEIVVDRSAIERVVLAGRVVDRKTGEPLRSFTLTPMIWSGEDQAMGSGVSVKDDQGRFRLAGIDPGRISLNVSAPGYATWTEAPRELAEGVQEYDVRLTKMRVIGVRLLDLAGEPFRGRASLSFRRLDGGGVPIQREGMSTTALDHSDPWSRAMQLPAEPLQIVVDVRDGEEARVFDIDLERDLSEEFEFRVEVQKVQPVEIGCLVLSAAPDFDDSGLEEQVRANRGVVQVPGCEPPKTRVEFVVRNARGAALLVGVLEPVAEGFRQRLEWPGTGQSQQGTLPFALLDARVTDRAATLEVAADGHTPVKLSLDPKAENAGLPRMLLLRRE